MDEGFCAVQVCVFVWWCAQRMSKTSPAPATMGCWVVAGLGLLMSRLTSGLYHDFYFSNPTIRVSELHL